MATTSPSRPHSVWLPSRSYDEASYNASTWVDTNHMTNTLIVRGLVVGVALGAVWIIGRSMLNDLMEEVKAGLT